MPKDKKKWVFGIMVYINAIYLSEKSGGWDN